MKNQNYNRAFTPDKISELKETYNKIKNEIDKITSLTEIDMWISDLDELKKKIKDKY